MTNEEWYDAEIAPALAALANRCQERGMAFVAAVEYAPGEHGGTYLVGENAGLGMQMIRMCSMTAPNVDSYIINVKKYCGRKGIPTDSSIFMGAHAATTKGQT